MNTGRATIGVAFVAIGVLVLLDQAEAVDAGRIVGDWWPVLFLVAAALQLLVRPPRRIAAAVYGAVGLVLLSITTGVVGDAVWTVLWPVLIIALGLWLILRPTSAGRSDLSTHADARIDVTAVFSGRRVTSTSRSFVGGVATAVFGGVDVDLTGAAIDGEAVLDLVALFGGVDVRVPPGWRVVLDGPAIFGANESSVPPPADPTAPTLRVRATAIFGGVDVKVRPSTRVDDRVPAPA